MVASEQQSAEQPSKFTELPSSQPSTDGFTNESPQRLSMQSFRQSSFWFPFPSSHSSMLGASVSTFASPHTATVQASVQLRLTPLLAPLSHCSAGGSTTPTPPPGTAQFARQ